MTKRKRRAIVISILVFAGTIVGMLHINRSPDMSNVRAVGGMLELQTGEAGEVAPILLDGEWELYPGVLIDPGRLDGDLNESDGDTTELQQSGQTGVADPFAAHRDIRTLIQVPGPWDNALPNGGPSGSGTYRLLITVPKEGAYGIKTGTIRTSARIYANGNLLTSIGTPSTDYATYELGSRPQTVYVTSDQRHIELVIHVSSYDYRAGGILKPIRFGAAEIIDRQDNQSRAVDSVAVIICLAFALHSFFSWLQRKNDRFLLHAAIVGLFLALYLSTLGEQLLGLIYHYDYYMRLRIQIFCMPTIAMQLLLFTKNLLPGHGNRFALRANLWYLAALVLFVLNKPSSSMFIPIGVSQLLISIGMVVTFVHIAWIMFRSMGDNEDSSDYLVVIFASLFSYWTVMLLKMLFEMNTGKIPDIMIVLTSFVVSLMAGDRLQADRRRAQALSEELLASDHMKNDFLAATSQELRTPLHDVIDLSRRLLEGQKGPLNQEQQEDLYLILNESFRLSGLVDDLSDATPLATRSFRSTAKPFAHRTCAARSWRRCSFWWVTNIPSFSRATSWMISRKSTPMRSGLSRSFFTCCTMRSSLQIRAMSPSVRRCATAWLSVPWRIRGGASAKRI